MSEKVLGFDLKNADYGKICKTCREGIEIDELPEDGMCPECGCGEGFEDVFVIEKSKLVSVRLRSESVDLKKLKEQIKKAFAEELFWINKADVAMDNPRVHLKKVKDDLLSWAEKQAGEK